MTSEGDAYAEIGSWLRRKREEAGLSREELAARSGLSLRAISDLERGRTRRPYPKSIGLLTAALGLPETTGPELVLRLRGGRNGVTPAVPRQLPAATAFFVGRAAELKILDGLLEDPPGSGNGMAAAPVIVAIGGIAGVGKTTLAVHWAHQIAAEFPDGQLYANLRGFDPSGLPVAAETLTRDFLDAFGIPPARIPASYEARLALYRTVLATKRVLIVLDNARDADQVQPLLPGSAGCFVLVTSRASLVGLAATEGAHLLTLDLPPAGEARELLARRLGAELVAAEPVAAGELIRLCAGLPWRWVLWRPAGRHVPASRLPGLPRSWPARLARWTRWTRAPRQVVCARPSPRPTGDCRTPGPGSSACWASTLGLTSAGRPPLASPD